MQYINRLSQKIGQFSVSFLNRNYHNPSVKVNREGKIWRRTHKLPAHINQTKSLMEGADFRYVDNRPTPYGSREYRRMLNQREIATQVVRLLEEMNYAESRWKNMEIEKENEKKNILDRKLKPKGGVVPSKESDVDV
ncbi:39S ribosomal protein L52, mitochondrial [Nilaparvata lugens]|uniref:39S ribosomal protein L52, mitochondrial n=1 Tax=Nilaparvata lugens TaxID=108931 RepID=UPI00193CC17A|nr:39S ribosomal protein L52, mitochondrial [Nilaparvata lugens]XP_039284700.1 39S ribosomal protein L52, mitochondrial [Nilaparvata lugens]